MKFIVELVDEGHEALSQAQMLEEEVLAELFAHDEHQLIGDTVSWEVQENFDDDQQLEALVVIEDYLVTNEIDYHNFYFTDEDN